MNIYRLATCFVLVGFVIGGCGETDPKQNKKSVVPVTPVESNLRSCELLLKNTDVAMLDRVEFAQSVDGFYKKRGEYTAIAFVAKSDSPLPSDSVRPVMGAGVAGALVVDKAVSRCFDGAGEEIPNALWTL